MNWEDLRIFIAIAREGTLSGAARSLNIDQATVSRRLASLEEQLDVRLVERLPREARVTEIGQRILHEAKDVENSTLNIERMSVQSKLERSRITLSAPPILARHFFAPNMLALSKLLPMTQLSILSDAHFVSLSRLEADLAVRLSPGVKDTDIIRKVGRMEFALYTHKEYPYLNVPEKWEFIGYSQRHTTFEHKEWLYKTINKNPVICEVADLSNQFEAACSGIGVAGIPCFLGDKSNCLIKLETPKAMLELDIWVAKHPDRRYDKLVVDTSDTIAQILLESGLGLTS